MYETLRLLTQTDLPNFVNTVGIELKIDSTLTIPDIASKASNNDPWMNSYHEGTVLITSNGWPNRWQYLCVVNSSGILKGICVAWAAKYVNTTQKGQLGDIITYESKDKPLADIFKEHFENYSEGTHDNIFESKTKVTRFI